MTRHSPRSARSTRRRTPLSRLTVHATALVLAAGLIGCSSGANTADGQRDSDESGVASSDATADTVLADVREQFRTTTDVPSVPLSTDLDLQAPPGFEQADVDALAARAVSILRRSTAPRLSATDSDADESVDYVYAKQPALTRFDFERDAVKVTNGRPWQWMAVSRFPQTPTPARVIRVAASAKKYEGRLADGTPAPFLTVVVEAHLVQEVPTGDDPDGRTTVPIVSYRAVSASSFRPRGGPDFWPAVRARMSPYGNDGCALGEEGSLLVPLTDPDVLREDLAALKASLRNPGVADTSFAADTSAEHRRTIEEQYQQQRAERCGDDAREGGD